MYCIEASRLARNGRDWHHLIDLCALTGALVIDPDGVYDPRLMNDRLLLGLKGTMSEYELSLLRQRGIAARDAKAGRPQVDRDALLRLAHDLPRAWAAAGADARAKQRLNRLLIEEVVINLDDAAQRRFWRSTGSVTRRSGSRAGAPGAIRRIAAQAPLRSFASSAGSGRTASLRSP